MHVPDGYLSPEVSQRPVSSLLLRSDSRFTNFAGTWPIGWSPHGHDGRHGLAAQMVNFQLVVVPVSGHLIGGVLAGMILGPWAGPLCLTICLDRFSGFYFRMAAWFFIRANILDMAGHRVDGGYAVATLVRRFCRKKMLGDRRRQWWLLGSRSLPRRPLSGAWNSGFRVRRRILSLEISSRRWGAIRSLIGIGAVALITARSRRTSWSSDPTLILAGSA